MNMNKRSEGRKVRSGGMHDACVTERSYGHTGPVGETIQKPGDRSRQWTGVMHAAATHVEESCKLIGLSKD